MTTFIGLALLLASTAFQTALAQTTNATCTSDYDWMKNSKGQSPCLVAAYLQSACSSPWMVRALPAGFAYDPPSDNSVNPCTCSSSVYDLMAACATCQGPNRGYPTWDRYKANCGNSVSTTPFPASVDVPGGTEIPAFAMRLGENWSNGYFNVKEAQLIAEGTLSPDATGSGTGSPSSTTSDPASTTPPQSAPSSDSPSLGPIIGGAVGGVLGLLLIATLAYYIRSKHKRDARNLKLAEAQNMILPQSPAPLSVSNFPIRPIPQQLPSYATSHGGDSSNPSFHGHHSSPSVDSAAPYMYSPTHGHQRSLSQTVSMTHHLPPQMTVVRSNTTAQQNRPLSPQSPTFSDIYSAQDRSDEPFYSPGHSQQSSSAAALPPSEIVQAPQPMQLSEKAQLRERERQRQAAGGLASPAPPAYSTPAPAGHQLVAIGDGTETWVSGSSQAGATHGDQSGNVSLRDGLTSPTSPGLNRAFSLATRNGDELQSYLGLRLATQSPGGLSTYSSTAAGDMYGGSSNAGDWPNEKS